MNTLNRLLINNLLSSIFSNFIWWALTFWTYLTTNNVLVTAYIAGIYTIFSALLSVYSGKLLDKYDKNKIIRFFSILQIVFMFLSYLVFFIQKNNLNNNSYFYLWIVLVLALISASLGSIRQLSTSTLVTSLVEHQKIGQTNGLISSISGISNTLTSLFSGLAVGFLNLDFVFVTTILILIVTTFDLYFINLPNHNVDVNQSSFKTADSLKYLIQKKDIFHIVIFTTINNFLGGVFMALLDPYGLSLVSVQNWGLIWSFLSIAYLLGGILISKFGLGKNELRTFFLINILTWTSSIFMTIQPWIWLLIVGCFLWLFTFPYLEACEATLLQKRIPEHMQGRILGLAQAIEQSSSPASAFIVGTITQLYAIPFMTDGLGAQLIGNWYGTGQSRGISLVFSIAGVVGLLFTIVFWKMNFVQLEDSIIE
ncbi:MAG: MFS transporter [Patescibacteria group bacterium]